MIKTKNTILKIKKKNKLANDNDNGVKVTTTIAGP